MDEYLRNLRRILEDEEEDERCWRVDSLETRAVLALERIADGIDDLVTAVRLS